ncbi:hypothetical protein DdX_03502 [Ditylenchus destructor]|uniref:Uncharacterized protein n=1 Tax=Ditylenchus destructor TaxID=166010 RepID=A0AAD4NF51_9BILA|nr:hypothetical protein DdX_03502 [Ditylenchus destructor]
MDKSGPILICHTQYSWYHPLLLTKKFSTITTVSFVHFPFLPDFVVMHCSQRLLDTQLRTGQKNFALLILLLNVWLCLIGSVAKGQAAAWPATSYSPYFQSLFAQASAPVAAIPSGLGAQAPSIPVPAGGPIGPGAPAFGGAAYAPGRRRRQSTPDMEQSVNGTQPSGY